MPAAIAAPAPPATLPPLAAPEIGHFFASQDEAETRKYQLDALFLSLARERLAECYEAIHRLYQECIRPLDGFPRPETAKVLAEMLWALIDVDGNSVGVALGQIDEAEAWKEAPVDDLPLYAWADSCRPHCFMREGGV